MVEKTTKISALETKLDTLNVPDLLKSSMKNSHEDQTQMKMLTKLMAEQTKATEKKQRTDKIKQNNEARAASRMNRLQAELEN
jgi:hypothetical protein